MYSFQAEMHESISPRGIKRHSTDITLDEFLITLLQEYHKFTEHTLVDRRNWLLQLAIQIKKEKILLNSDDWVHKVLNACV